jgi:hypothetical protein
MSPRRLITNIFLIPYLLLTAYAFFFTMVRIELPAIPHRVLFFFYGMMAPYQGYTTYNFDLLAEGKKVDGVWERIDLDPYYPMILGHRVMFRRLRSFHAAGEALSKQKYTELAMLLQKHEAEKGRTYESIRLMWQTWPMSTDGWDALRREPFVTNYPLTEISL